MWWITSAVALVTSDAAMRFRSTLLAVNWDWKGRDERKYTKPTVIDVKSVSKSWIQIFHGNCISTYSLLTLLEYDTELNLWWTRLMTRLKTIYLNKDSNSLTYIIRHVPMCDPHNLTLESKLLILIFQNNYHIWNFPNRCDC